MAYQLPSHPSKLCQDPLGICDESPATTVWDVISTAISAVARSSAADRLPDLIETLVYSVHGNGSVDTRGLRGFLGKSHPHPSFYPALYAAALSLPELFPSHEVPYLNDENRGLALTTDQLNALLAHQTLGTLDQAIGGWDYPTFLCWYAGDNPHSMAVEGYLTTLFHHFSNLEAYPRCWQVRVLFFEVSQAEEVCWETGDKTMQLKFIPIDEENEPSVPETLETSAVVVSSNRQPGFGPSGTQEERIFSMSILLCPLILCCPTLPPKTALIVSPTPIHATWRGHNRTARLTSLYPVADRPLRYHVFLDALELDNYDQRGPGLPDLAADHVERELRKFYAGCIGLRALCAPLPPPAIEVGPWGCGAFCGNVVVKATIMAMAASEADVQLELRLRKDRSRESELIARVMEAGLTVGGVMTALKRHCEEFRSCEDAEAFVQLLLDKATGR